MSERSELIQLETGDDAASVRDRLSFLRGQRVLLIWPEDGTVLTRKLDLVLLQREAMRRAIKLALVTHDEQVVKHAAELNISTFETIGASERGRWKRARSKSFIARDQRPDDEPIPPDLAEAIRRDREEEYAVGRRGRILRRLIMLLIALGILAGIGYVIGPTATVTLTLAKNRVQAEAQVIADLQSKIVDVENRIIPATKLTAQIEETGKIETSGKQDLGKTPATGSVVFINQRRQAVKIPAGTVVATSAGTPIQFQTTKEASLPGGVGLQIEVPIEALPESAGTAGNVNAGVINTVVGSLASSIAVRNIAATYGGDSRSARVVTQSDHDRVLATVRQQLQERAFSEMQSRLSKSQFIVLETVRIAEERPDWLTYSAGAGEAADALSLTMKAVVEAVAIDDEFGKQIVYAQMSQQIGRGPKINPDSVTYQRGDVVSVEMVTGRITFLMSGTGIAIGQIDPEQVAGRLVGQPVNEALAYLASELPLQNGTQPQIVVSPEWIGRLPLLPMRITLQLLEPSL